MLCGWPKFFWQAFTATIKTLAIMFVLFKINNSGCNNKRVHYCHGPKSCLWNWNLNIQKNYDNKNQKKQRVFITVGWGEKNTTVIHVFNYGYQFLLWKHLALDFIRIMDMYKKYLTVLLFANIAQCVYYKSIPLQSLFQ